MGFLGRDGTIVLFALVLFVDVSNEIADGEEKHGAKQSDGDPSDPDEDVDGLT